MFMDITNLVLLGYWVNEDFYPQNHEDESRGENTVGPTSGPELENLGPKYILAQVKNLDILGKSVRNKTWLIKHPWPECFLYKLHKYKEKQ